MSQHTNNLNKVTAAGLLISLGLVYGDIGTSPLYTLKAIISELNKSGPLQANDVLGVISCIIWTLTLQTTIKYVLITLKADNNGEGGIFSLYSLVRRRFKWLVIPAIVGGAAMLADSVITPSITVTTAIEGLDIQFPGVPVIPIVLAIITAIFVVQQFGSATVGKAFGPVMLLWFSIIGGIGLYHMAHDWSILKALNPWYAVQILLKNPHAMAILGGVFLCTTGAEALYSDMGHCGRQNIRISWFFVKLMLIFNYLGQGVYIINEPHPHLMQNPFFELVPDQFVIYLVALATLAAIIASQALITGSFTLISEAVKLNFWPKIRINYPSNQRGQLYVPSINWLLFAGCVGIVLILQESAKMEGAYGLSINITFLMTTILVAVYMRSRRVPMPVIGVFVVIYMAIELTFFVGNAAKFVHGGYITVLIGSVLFWVMWSCFTARKIRNRFVKFDAIDEYYKVIEAISEDETIPMFCSQLVYLTSANNKHEVESKVIYSLLQKEPKRADVYWLVHVDVVDSPFTQEYTVTQLIDKKLIRIDFRLGFRVEQRINLLFRKVVENMVENGEIDIISSHPSLKKFKINGDFRFVLLEKIVSRNDKLRFWQKRVLHTYEFMKMFALSEERSFGLDSSYVDIEKVPLVLGTTARVDLVRKG